jgi:hypothetical protein
MDRLRNMSAQMSDLKSLLPASREDAALLDTETLVAIITTAPLINAAVLRACALCWSVAEERGADLAALVGAGNREYYRQVRRIANGSVSAEAVVAFNEAKQPVRSRVLEMPVKVQEKLAADSRVPLLDPKTPDQLDNHVMRDVSTMERWELEQVFDRGAKELRTVQQQAVYLRQMRPIPLAVPRRGPELTRGRLALDRKANRIRITEGTDADLEDAVALLKAVGYEVKPPASE